MAERPSAGPGADQQVKPAPSAEAGGECTQLVLDAYTSTIRGLWSAHAAFEAALSVYRAHNPNVVEQEARRAVANMICWKA